MGFMHENKASISIRPHLYYMVQMTQLQYISIYFAQIAFHKSENRKKSTWIPISSVWFHASFICGNKSENESDTCIWISHVFKQIGYSCKNESCTSKKIDIGEWSQLRWTPSVITWLLPMAQWRTKSSNQDMQCKCGLKGLLNTCYEI